MSDLGPSLTVLGVYRVPIDDRQLREDLRRYYFFGNAARDTKSGVYSFIERCFPLVLFDTTLNDLDERFQVGDITQEMPNALRKAWQAPYDEALLSPDGTQVINRKTGCAKGLRAGRIAFYFHYYDPSMPMYWSYGQFSAPPVQLISQQLWELVPYRPL